MRRWSFRHSSDRLDSRLLLQQVPDDHTLGLHCESSDGSALHVHALRSELVILLIPGRCVLRVLPSQRVDILLHADSLNSRASINLLSGYHNVCYNWCVLPDSKPFHQIIFRMDNWNSL
jgi:hypothetical protein